MTFDEWYRQNMKEFNQPPEMREISEFGWLRRAFDAGVEHGIHTERAKQIERTPVQEFKQNDKVQVFVEERQQWIDGVVAKPASTLRNDKEVLVWITRLDGGTDEQGSRDEARNFPIFCVRKVIRCPYCNDRGGWEDADEGQWVSCHCTKETK